jgi:hypothetical protein
MGVIVSARPGALKGGGHAWVANIAVGVTTFGSKADMTQSNSDVRFTPKSGHS